MVYAVNDKDNVIAVFLKVVYAEMPRNVLSGTIAFEREELALQVS